MLHSHSTVCLSGTAIEMGDHDQIVADGGQQRNNAQKDGDQVVPAVNDQNRAQRGGERAANDDQIVPNRNVEVNR